MKLNGDAISFCNSKFLSEICLSRNKWAIFISGDLESYEDILNFLSRNISKFKLISICGENSEILHDMVDDIIIDCSLEGIMTTWSLEDIGDSIDEFIDMIPSESNIIFVHSSSITSSVKYFRDVSSKILNSQL